MATVMGGTAQEKKWRSEEDAYSLVRVEEIKSDPKRMKAALAMVKQMRIEQEKSLARYKAVEVK